MKLDKLFKTVVNRETISYLIVGVSTTVVNLAVYTIFCQFMPYAVANLISLILTKLYAYFMNKIFVFRTRLSSIKDTVIEFLKFMVTRGLTGVIDYFGLIILVSGLGFDELISKYVLQIVITILNFFFGKFLVFRKKEEDTNSICEDD